jgi:hypothetical protein
LALRLGLTDSVDVIEPLPVNVTEVGLKLALVREGVPLKLSEIGPLKLEEVIVIVPVPVELRGTFREVGLALREMLPVGEGALTTRVTLVEDCRLPLLPVTVML